MDLKLTGKNALVLGSTSGLGRAIARQLISEGAHVALSGQNPERAREAVDAAGARLAVTGDLSRPGEASRMVEQAAAALGGLDIIVINTGGGTPGGIIEATPENQDRAYQAMLRPALEAARAATPFLKESATARMIFITARSIVEATPDLALSSVFRSGVAAAARSLALELAPDILVNVVIPGQFDTPAYGKFSGWIAKRDNRDPAEVRRADARTNPLGRLGRAEEFADVVTFLCSPRASFVTGAVIRIDGGAVIGFH